MELFKKKKEVNYKMVVLAREARGISQTDLAEALSISQGNLSKIEQGIYPVNDDLLIKISSVLSYPESFFFEQIDKLPVNQQFHRKRKTIQKKYLTQLDSNLTIKRLHIKKLLQSVEIEDKIPRLNIEEYGSPEVIANKLRLHWKIPNGPILNFVSILEDNGLIVIYTTSFEKLDGMAVPDEENIPIIYLNKTAPPDRQRFTLAHELGHIVMHSNYIPMVNDDVEDEADRFASEFLMPTKEFKTTMMGRKMNVDDLAELKHYWQVSMASMLYKLSKLNLITPQKNRSLNVELSRRGYKKIEPRAGVQIDSPTLFNELVEAHLNELDYTKKELSEILHITVEELESTYPLPRFKVVNKNKNKYGV